ncbi:MAG: FAD-binding protein [Myxococcota bacterium]
MSSIPFSDVRARRRWKNFHGTVQSTRVDTYCTPDVPTKVPADAPPPLRRHMDAVRALVGEAFERRTSLRTVGSTWSMSSIIEPDRMILDPGRMSRMEPVLESVMTDAYRRQRRRTRRSLVYVEGGATIASLNRRLGERRLALPTSGAGNGHRVAGCVATGTHGSAIHYGAVHDAVKAVHLVVGPNRAVFLQPEKASCSPHVSQWLENATGVRTDHVVDDELFHAAQVSLGALGIVFGLVLEVEPLYMLRRRVRRMQPEDKQLLEAIQRTAPELIFPDEPTPHHFEVVFDPYGKKKQKSAYVVTHYRESAEGVRFRAADPMKPDMASDHLGLIGDLSEALDGRASTRVIKKVIRKQLRRRYKDGERAKRFPGETFGYTGLPPGEGVSTEIVVDTRKALDALEHIRTVLAEEESKGRLLLGAVALRFVPRSAATLAMNANARNTFIELPSIASTESETLYRLCWEKLKDEGIAYTCHWGQLHDLSRGQLDEYFGKERVESWRSSRKKLLPTRIARGVFANPTVDSAGLI